ncbi:MAG TPA: hypothetical protein VHD63_26785 [Ktedonobacteraceae bacterium]|nr:hypothetical protein [Ktedonobacteraceae bacterium]
MPEQLTLRFSLEEMSYLRRALKLDYLPGLAPRDEQKLDEEQEKLLLSAADRSLRARGVVRLMDEDRRAIDPVTAGLLRAYAQPQPLLFVDSFRDTWGQGQWLYAFNDPAIFEQSEPEPGVLQLAILGTRVALQTRLRQIIRLSPRNGADALERGRLPADLLQEGAKRARSEPEEARRLFAGELPEATAQALARAFHTVQAVYYLARWSAHTTRVEAALTILQDEDYLFALALPAADSSRLEVIPATSEQIWTYLARLLPRKES